MTTTELRSWGRYPHHDQRPTAIDWRDRIGDRLRALAGEHGTTLAYGNGLSYGDSCLAASDQVLHTSGMDHVIAADWDTGLIRAEAGITLADILRMAIPRGWFLPVSPGTKFVTLGGAIANDVHGKNHHVRGTFGRHVPRFSLVRSDQDHVVCSREDNASLYAATIGGLGLTGIIAWADLQLIPITSSFISRTSTRFSHIDGFFDASRSLDASNEYTVAWVDCLASGRSLGRGIYLAGNHARDLERVIASDRQVGVPLTPPVSAINKLTLRAFNEVYFRAHPPRTVRRRVDYDSFFYPLDRVRNWNRVYGPRGFQQFQCVIPIETARDATMALLRTIAGERTGSFLAVLKKFGSIQSPGMLSFPTEGLTFALDFPQDDVRTKRLFARLDAVVRDAGGRQYPAKDAHVSPSDFQSAFPQWEQLEALRDPALMSRFWKRVTGA